ncbi:hypothetical protein ABVT39_022738 [Epinephelus coioides]
MESDAENAQVDAVAKIIFWALLFCSDGITDLSVILHQHLVANQGGLNFLHMHTRPGQQAKGDDFSSGTSSRSTKLIHGGVRYLQKAIMKLDYKQEPYFAICMNIRGSWSFLSSRRVPLTPLSFVPPGGWNEWWCEPSGGQHNDARVNLAIALTAARYGAAIANYTEVVHLLKRADPQTGKERVCGAHCRDGITGQEFDVRAKCVINATGPFTDALWKMDDQKNPDICQPSAGVHIVIPGYYSIITASQNCTELEIVKRMSAVKLTVQRRHIQRAAVTQRYN